MNKTGTTAVQSHMASVREKARGDGLVYPDVFGDNHSYPLAAMFRGDDPKAVRTLRRRGVGDLVDRSASLRAELAALAAATAAEGHDLLLSGEGMGQFSSAACAALRETLAPFERIVVLGQLRPPRSFARSAAQQRVRFQFSFAALAARPPLPSYRNRFAAFVEAFGRENVRLGVFHPSRLVDGCAFRTLVAMIDRPLPSLADERASVLNSAMSMTAAKVLSALHSAANGGALDLPPAVANALAPPGRFGRRRPFDPSAPALRQKAIRIPGPRFAVPFEILTAVDDAVSDDAAYAERLLGEPLGPLDDAPSDNALRLADVATWSDAEIDAAVAHLGRR